MSTQMEVCECHCGDLVRWDKLVKAMGAVCSLTHITELESTPVSKGCGTLVHRIVDGENITAILTDSQVIYNKEMAEKTVATFRCDGKNETLDIHLHPDIFFKTSGEYEFTLVGVKPEDINSLSEKLSIGPLQLQRITQRDVYSVKTVQIAQYPEGKSKWLSVARVCEIQAKHILYSADTTTGCRGSPVFFSCNEDCFVIAVHKSDGVRSSTHKEPVNKGVFINHILDYIYGHCVQLLQPETKPTFSSQERSRIGRKLSIKWEMVALASGKFEVEETANIRRNHNQDDEVWKATIMLGDYEKKRGTRDNLASALREFGEIELADKVQAKYFQTHAD